MANILRIQYEVKENFRRYFPIDRWRMKPEILATACINTEGVLVGWGKNSLPWRLAILPSPEPLPPWFRPQCWAWHPSPPPRSSAWHPAQPSSRSEASPRDVLGQGLAAHSYHLHLRHKMGLVQVLLCYLIPNLLLLLANVKLLDWILDKIEWILIWG